MASQPSIAAAAPAKSAGRKRPTLGLGGPAINLGGRPSPAVAGAGPAPSAAAKAGVSPAAAGPTTTLLGRMHSDKASIYASDVLLVRLREGEEDRDASGPYAAFRFPERFSLDKSFLVLKRCRVESDRRQELAVFGLSNELNYQHPNIVHFVASKGGEFLTEDIRFERGCAADGTAVRCGANTTNSRLLPSTAAGGAATVSMSQSRATVSDAAARQLNESSAAMMGYFLVDAAVAAARLKYALGPAVLEERAGGEDRPSLSLLMRAEDTSRHRREHGGPELPAWTASSAYIPSEAAFDTLHGQLRREHEEATSRAHAALLGHLERLHAIHRKRQLLSWFIANADALRAAGVAPASEEEASAQLTQSAGADVIVRVSVTMEDFRRDDDRLRRAKDPNRPSAALPLTDELLAYLEKHLLLTELGERLGAQQREEAARVNADDVATPPTAGGGLYNSSNTAAVFPPLPTYLSPHLSSVGTEPSMSRPPSVAITPPPSSAGSAFPVFGFPSSRHADPIVGSVEKALLRSSASAPTFASKRVGSPAQLPAAATNHHRPPSAASTASYHSHMPAAAAPSPHLCGGAADTLPASPDPFAFLNIKQRQHQQDATKAERRAATRVGRLEAIRNAHRKFSTTMNRSVAQRRHAIAKNCADDAALSVPTGPATAVLEGADVASRDKLSEKLPFPVSLERRLRLARAVGFQALLGLGFLNHHGVLHRDIKPENCLINHYGTVKIIDFGTAHRYTADTFHRSSAKGGGKSGKGGAGATTGGQKTRGAGGNGMLVSGCDAATCAAEQEAAESLRAIGAATAGGGGGGGSSGGDDSAGRGLDGLGSRGPNTSTGTIGYRAPEMDAGRPHGFAVDLWSLGVVLWHIVVGADLRDCADANGPQQSDKDAHTEAFKKLRSEGAPESLEELKAMAAARGLPCDDEDDSGTANAEALDEDVECNGEGAGGEAALPMNIGRDILEPLSIRTAEQHVINTRVRALFDRIRGYCGLNDDVVADQALAARKRASRRRRRRQKAKKAVVAPEGGGGEAHSPTSSSSKLGAANNNGGSTDAADADPFMVAFGGAAINSAGDFISAHGVFTAEQRKANARHLRSVASGTDVAAAATTGALTGPPPLSPQRSRAPLSPSPAQQQKTAATEPSAVSSAGSPLAAVTATPKRSGAGGRPTARATPIYKLVQSTHVSPITTTTTVSTTNDAGADASANAAFSASPPQPETPASGGSRATAEPLVMRGLSSRLSTSSASTATYGMGTPSASSGGAFLSSGKAPVQASAALLMAEGALQSISAAQLATPLGSSSIPQGMGSSFSRNPTVGPTGGSDFVSLCASSPQGTGLASNDAAFAATASNTLNGTCSSSIVCSSSHGGMGLYSSSLFSAPPGGSFAATGTMVGHPRGADEDDDDTTESSADGAAPVSIPCVGYSAASHHPDGPIDSVARRLRETKHRRRAQAEGVARASTIPRCTGAEDADDLVAASTADVTGASPVDSQALKVTTGPSSAEGVRTGFKASAERRRALRRQLDEFEDLLVSLPGLLRADPSDRFMRPRYFIEKLQTQRQWRAGQRAERRNRRAAQGLPSDCSGGESSSTDDGSPSSPTEDEDAKVIASAEDDEEEGLRSLAAIRALRHPFFADYHGPMVQDFAERDKKAVAKAFAAAEAEGLRSGDGSGGNEQKARTAAAGGGGGGEKKKPIERYLHMLPERVLVNVRRDVRGLLYDSGAPWEAPTAAGDASTPCKRAK